MNQLKNKDCIIRIGITLLIIIVIIWFLSPKFKGMFMKESFNAEANGEAEVNSEVNSEGESGAVPEEGQNVDVQNPPYVDGQTGAVIDGPGWEKGTTDDILIGSPATIPSNYYFLDDGAGGAMSIQHNRVVLVF